MKNNPIGIFDSGVGGLTVANAVVRQLPNEDIIYYGDTVHLPYGDKSAEAVREYSLGIVQFLLNKGCKMIVVACNTASAAAYDVIKQEFKDKVLLVDVIEPITQAVAARHFRKVGVIGTKGTINAGTYEKSLHALQPGLIVENLATPLLVPMIEEGFIHHRVSNGIIENYLERAEFNDIDALLLACTHYPLLRPEIEAFFQDRVEVFDSTNVVAQTVFELLQKHDLLNDYRRQMPQFFVSDYTDNFEKTTRLFYQEDIKLRKENIWAEDYILR